MLEYLAIAIPAFFAAAILGATATIDPIESSVSRVGTAEVYQSAGFDDRSMELLLHAEIEKIIYSTGSSHRDKRVRVDEVTSGVEDFADAVFSLGAVVQSGQRAFGILDYVIEVDFTQAGDDRLGAYVQFRDAFSGNYVGEQNFSVTADEDDIKREQVYALVTDVSKYVVATSEPYLYAAYLYRLSRDGRAPVKEAVDFIDATLPGARQRDFPWLYNLRGMIAAEAGADAFAIRDYHAALQSDPHFAPARLNWGRILLKLGDHDKAAEYFRKGLTDPRLHGIGYVYLAQAELGVGDVEDALARLERAERIEPHLALLYDVRAEALARTGDEIGAERARRAAERARAVMPDQFRFEPY